MEFSRSTSAEALSDSKQKVLKSSHDLVSCEEKIVQKWLQIVLNKYLRIYLLHISRPRL